MKISGFLQGIAVFPHILAADAIFQEILRRQEPKPLIKTPRPVVILQNP
jgi:hypothetical protein